MRHRRGAATSMSVTFSFGVAAKMTKLDNLTGQRFGKLAVIERAPNLGKNTAWLCRCDCGEYRAVPAYRLKSGETTSCGCANRIKQIAAGQRFGALTTLCVTTKPNSRKRYWLCRCDCGNLKYVPEYCLQTDQTHSCGCQTRQLISSHLKRHGGTGTRLFNVWSSMKQRCYNPAKANYSDYGGRGITVCDEWRESFEAFRDWALSSGYDPNAPTGKCTLDRIDVDGNYEPSNCRWVDAKVQANNKRPHKQKPTRTHAVIRIDDSGNEERFESIVSAARAMGDERKRASIGACCRGKHPTAYGYKWRYA